MILSMDYPVTSKVPRSQLTSLSWTLGGAGMIQAQEPVPVREDHMQLQLERPTINDKQPIGKQEFPGKYTFAMPVAYCLG